MRKFLSTFVSVFLLGTFIFTSACNNNATSQVVTCLGDIGVKVVASVATDDAPLTFVNLLTVVPECINAAVASFSSNNTQPSSPQIEVHEASQDRLSTGTVDSNTWGNCTPYIQTLRFDFSVYFQLAVGGASNRESFSQSPTGSSTGEMIARQLFENYGDRISSITTNGPSQSVMLEVPANTQVVLHLPILLDYREGEARVTQTDGSTVSLPWFFTDGYQQNGQITWNTSSC